MKRRKWHHSLFFLLITGLLAALSSTGVADQQPDPGKALESGEFTGEILPVFYVSDLRQSLAFYKDLGFQPAESYEHFRGDNDTIWSTDPAPYYIEMDANGRRFALHLIGQTDTLRVSGMRHYFGVRDVDAHHELVVNNGIDASEIYDRPWMRMFFVRDPDGHVLSFFIRPDSTK